MFPLFLKNLSFLPSRLSRKVFTRFKVRGFSSSLSSSSPPDVSVWWHLDSCPVPSGFSFSKVAPSITAAVRANGIMGTIHIRVYGNFNSSDFDKEALISNNITLASFTAPTRMRKIYTGAKNNTYKHFLTDFNDWVSTNPPPLHLFLIFGNEEFSSSGILQRLRMCNYNILLACPGRAHVAALCHAATIMWEWSSMLKGDDLIGKHFNYSPDGPTYSWYENSNVPLENPFSVVELHTSSQNSEEIYKPTFDIKVSQASKSFSRQVLKILCSHPNGISIGDLRAELTKCDMPLVKRFYGNKKFSNFLISISYVQLQYLGGGNFWVCLVPSKTSAITNNQKDGAATQKLHNDGKNMDRIADGVPKVSSSCVSSEGDDLKSFQSIPSQGKPLGEYVDGKSSFPLFMDSIVHQPPNELQKKSMEVDVARAPLPQIQLLPNVNNISKKSDNDIVKSDDGNPEFLEKINPSQNPSTSNDCTILKNKHEIPTRNEVDEVCRSPFTSTFCSWISSWWTFWKSNAKSEIDQSSSHFEEPKSSELQQDLSHPLQPHWENFKFRVAVWWDFDSCGVPSGISFLNVAPSIMGVLRANGIKGPIHIDAYGDVSQLSQIKQEALFLSGIDLHHISGGKNKNKCLVDWFSQNPSPIHRFLISDDKDIDFSCTLLKNLRRRHDIFFLACPGKTNGYVSRVPFIKWRWSSVLKGKYLTGKYFCYPPKWYTKMRVPLEYPREWYRNWKVCLENPFSAAEEPTSSQNAEIHIAAEEPTSSQNAEIRIPSSWIKFFGEDLTECNRLCRQIKEVLSSYPNGISIGELKIRMGIPGRIKMFTEAIASMSQVQLLYIGDDNFCVRLIPSTTSIVKKKKQRDADHSEVPVLFSTDYFGDDVENFVFSSRGSRLISQSRSREDLAHRLQRHGPMFFMSLTENEILQLVELLITKLKWLKESPSEAFPFMLTQSVRLNRSTLVVKELLIGGTSHKILVIPLSVLQAR